MSANNSKNRIISLDEYRAQRAARTAPPSFDPEAVAQRITRARVAPTAEERDIARELVLDDATTMLQVLGVMGGEIGAFRQQIRSLAQQSADTATIISVLLAHAGGVVEIPRQWFVDYEVPTGGGFMVNEDEHTVYIRAVEVDPDTLVRASLESAGEQTTED